MYRLEDISIENFYNQTKNAYDFFITENNKNKEFFFPSSIKDISLNYYNIQFSEEELNSVLNKLNIKADKLTITDLEKRKRILNNVKIELKKFTNDISMNDISNNDISNNIILKMKRQELFESLEFYLYIVELYLIDINRVENPLNIQGRWDDWRPCDAVCNGIDPYKIGRTNRIYRMQDISNGYTNTIETDSTCAIPCPVDCSGGWSNWTNCEANCINNESSARGKRTRIFNVNTKAVNSGNNCDYANGYLQVDTSCEKTCPVNCEGHWEDWSNCEPTSACDGYKPFTKGIQKRKYIVTKPATQGGLSCIHENNYIETQECESKCNVDSMFFWMAVALVAVLIIIGLYFAYTKFNSSGEDDGEGEDGDSVPVHTHTSTKTAATTVVPATVVPAAVVGKHGKKIVKRG